MSTAIAAQLILKHYSHDDLAVKRAFREQLEHQ